MKLSVAIAGENALPSAFVVLRGFESSIKTAYGFGYHGVELALKSADEINPSLLYGWLKKYNMEVSCISTGQVFAASGLYFTHPNPAIRNRALKTFAGLINLAKDFGGIVNIGRVRGAVAEGQTLEEAEQLFVDALQYLCDVAKPLGVTIIIEPVNRYEINFINNLDEGAGIIAKADRDNLGLMPDVFHMNIEDAGIGKSLIRNGGLIKYIHLADSNRLAPGQGHLDFSDVFSSLKAIGFDGWGSVEILPKPDSETAARQAAGFCLPIIRKYNEGWI